MERYIDINCDLGEYSSYEEELKEIAIMPISARQILLAEGMLEIATLLEQRFAGLWNMA